MKIFSKNSSYHALGKVFVAGFGLVDIGLALILLPDPTQVTTVVGSVALIVNAAITITSDAKVEDAS